MTVEEKRNSIIEAVDNLPYEEQNFIVKHLYESIRVDRSKRISELENKITELKKAQFDLDERFNVYQAPRAETV